MDSIRELTPSQFPKSLIEIPVPPKRLFIIGTLPSETLVHLTVVGSRKATKYGIDVCEKLISGLRGYPVVIVSGLALGIDAIAHKTAISVGLPTISVPGSGLSEKVLYPRSHLPLAKEIVERGGCLLSEFEPDFSATVWSFPQRNRIMAGISKAVLVIEAERKSGTLVTAKYATDTNRDVLAVPGSVFSPSSDGPNWLIRSGATPITSTDDLIEALGFEVAEREVLAPPDLSPEESKLFEILAYPKTRDEIFENLQLPAHTISALLSMLEIKGVIKESGGTIRRI